MTKKDKKDLIKALDEIRESSDLWKEEMLVWIRNLLEEYWLEYSFRFLREERLTSDELEDYAKAELESWWLTRLYYFMWDVNFASEDIVKLDWYWNCEEVLFSDITDEIDDIINQIEELEE